MAVTDLAYTDLTLNGGVAEPAGTTLTTGAGNELRLPHANGSRLVLRVTNTGGAALNFTVKAGTYPPSIAAGQGDLTVSVPATTGVRLITIEDGRFKQNDGSILVTASATTGTVTAYRLPKGL